jgi:hypothetical protein
MASDWIGMSGTIASVAASVTKPAPVTPEAPFDVIMAYQGRRGAVIVASVAIAHAFPGSAAAKNSRSSR